ncbi:unnamed protein product [Paramecium pentaurelia]|uniref:Uncharacterized protein n=1 Tax=Paramecium pentaurelia TaxID=43138 RepID=A0A8S1VKN6_9CILI|nr:unnamed protein product [Paramecium pentaurelia]
MQQLQIQLQNSLNQLNENNQKFLELIFPQQNTTKSLKKQKIQTDKFTQTIDMNQQHQKTSALIEFNQNQLDVIDDMIKEFEFKISQQLEQQQFDQYKQRISQQQLEINNLKKKLQSRLDSKYGPNHLEVEINKKEILKYQKMIKKQQKENQDLNQLNQQYEIAENALQSIQQSKTL